MSSGLIPGLSVYKGKMLKRADGEIKKPGRYRPGKESINCLNFNIHWNCKDVVMYSETNYYVLIIILIFVYVR